MTQKTLDKLTKEFGFDIENIKKSATLVDLINVSI